MKLARNEHWPPLIKVSQDVNNRARLPKLRLSGPGKFTVEDEISYDHTV